ncbi:MAG TPA: hypothetical protein [Caudoviricetes sp.]|nr:MAG TPA: hypothetical protein [Caudoviricetes sp.]
MAPEYEHLFSFPGAQSIVQVAIILNYRIFMSELFFLSI